MNHARFIRSSFLIVAVLLSQGLAARAHAIDLSSYDGQQLYARFCASCHGTAGHGDGPVASSLKVIVPDLTGIAKRQGGTFPAEKIQQIIDGRMTRPPHGTRDMPVWGLEFSQADGQDTTAQQRAERTIGRLVDYIRTLQRK